MAILRSNHIPYLDGWRGVAIVLVLIGHFNDIGLVWLGPFGVMLFFALSGRLMCELLFIKKVELVTFFFRRFSRILPTFWLFLLIVFLYWTFLATVPYVPTVGEFFSTALFLRTYYPEDVSILSLNWPIGHIWSLNVEEHSYIFLALGAMLARLSGLRILTPLFLVGSLVVALLFNIAYFIEPPTGASPWQVRSECAAIGILAGVTFWYFRECVIPGFTMHVHPVVPVVTLIVAALCKNMYEHKGLDVTVAPLCLAFTVVYMDRLPKAIMHILASSQMRWFGLCSFSLYLWQQAFFLATLNDRLPTTVGLILSLAVGTCSFYFFENPIRKLLNRWWDKRQTGASVHVLRAREKI